MLHCTVVCYLILCYVMLCWAIMSYYTHLHIELHTCIHTYIYTYTHTYIHTNIHTCMYTCIPALTIYTNIIRAIHLILCNALKLTPNSPRSPSSLVVDVPTGQQRDDVRAPEILRRMTCFAVCIAIDTFSICLFLIHAMM